MNKGKSRIFLRISCTEVAWSTSSCEVSKKVKGGTVCLFQGTKFSTKWLCQHLKEFWEFVPRWNLSGQKMLCWGNSSKTQKKWEIVMIWAFHWSQMIPGVTRLRHMPQPFSLHRSNALTFEIFCNAFLNISSLSLYSKCHILLVCHPKGRHFVFYLEVMSSFISKRIWIGKII